MIGEADVARIVARIVELCDPDRIYVFGSYAKGTLKPTSDLDLIVVKPSRVPRARRGRDVMSVLSAIAVELDLLFFTPDELRAELADPYSLISAVMPSARTIYERGVRVIHARQ